MMKALGFYLFHLFHNFRRAGGGGGDWVGGLDSKTVENGGWAGGGIGGWAGGGIGGWAGGGVGATWGAIGEWWLGGRVAPPWS